MVLMAPEYVVATTKRQTNEQQHSRFVLNQKRTLPLKDTSQIFVLPHTQIH